MPLTAGTRLGPYVIVAPLGAGGMGEVYRATDSRLDRAVAVKVLPAHLATDPEHRQRFEREARAVSALAHPHICALYDVGHDGDVEFLVMEIIEGESLADRLAKGAVPVAQAFRCGIEILEALDAAHRRGIVHRDLKPGNVMLTRAGVKLLDFGLAKQTALEIGGSETRLQTPQTNITAQGTIVGTLQYMSPEQLEGHEADARSDLFAFGAVLHEMVTGKPAFEARSQASLISAVLTIDPPPVSAVQPLAPAALDYVIARCLTKDPEDRWQTARDLLAELRRVAGATGSGAALGAVRPATTIAAARPAAARTSLPWTIAAIAALVAAGLGTWTILRPAAVDRSPSSPSFVKLSLDPNALLGNFAISPDGRRLAFVGSGERRNDTQLWIRDLDKPLAVPIAGSEGAAVAAPAFSPDGSSLVFIATGALKRVLLSGGAPVTLAQGAIRRAAWSPDDQIYFSTERGISRVPAIGGSPTEITRKDSKTGELWNINPVIVPGGLVFEAYKSADVSELMVLSFETGTTRRLGANGSPIALIGAQLLFAQDYSLLVAPFDTGKLALGGNAAPLLHDERLAGTTDQGTSVAAARTGLLAYVTDAYGVAGHLLTLVDRHGRPERLPFPPNNYADPRVSPDGTRVVVHQFQGTSDNWAGDLRRGALTRLTFDPGEDETPIWSPDGRNVFYSSTREGVSRAIYRRAADGTGAEELIWSGTGHVHLAGCTPDASTIILGRNEGLSTRIEALSLSDRKVTPLVTRQFEVSTPALSPDGHWLAYASNESGHAEIYVQPYPAGEGRWQISTSGGSEPVWARNSKEIFFRGATQLMAVAFTTSPTFTPSTPVGLFDDVYANVQGESHTAYDVTPDGYFLMVAGSEGQQHPSEVNLVFDLLSPGGPGSARPPNSESAR